MKSKTKVYSVYQIPANVLQIKKNSDWVKLAKKYSKMKYGSRKEIYYFSQLLLSSFKSDFLYSGGNVYVTSTFLNDIESSSHYIAKEFQKGVSYQRYLCNLNASIYMELFSKKKKQIYQDYGKVNDEIARSNSQKNQILLSIPLLNSEDLLIVINDAYVTGAQQIYHEKTLRNSGVVCNILYLFIIQFQPYNNFLDVESENFFNNYETNDEDKFIKTILRLDKDNLIVWNKRMILRFFDLNEFLFKQTIGSLKITTLRNLFEKSLFSSVYSISNSKYKYKVKFLEQTLGNNQ